MSFFLPASAFIVLDEMESLCLKMKRLRGQFSVADRGLRAKITFQSPSEKKRTSFSYTGPCGVSVNPTGGSLGEQPSLAATLLDVQANVSPN